MEFHKLSACEIARGVKEKRFTAEEVARESIERIKTLDKKYNSVVTLCEEQALAAARRVDEAIVRGEDPGPLAGVPFAVKDNFCTNGIETTCCSNMLKGWVPQYDATAVKNMKEAGAVLVGKTNMDEFAMGSTTESSIFGPTLNPRDTERVPGGSSGGSAAVVAAGLVPVSLGSDTGGSVRQPAAFCGVQGMKPSYGQISRYGIVAYASSLDQVGPIARNVEDLAVMMDVLAKEDPNDTTCDAYDRPSFSGALDGASLKGKKVAVLTGYDKSSIDAPLAQAIDRAVEICREAGAEIVEASLPITMEHTVACYYMVALGDASSKLACYDGMRYGHHADGRNLSEMYKKSRMEGFGEEVRKRILVGTCILTRGYYENYFRPRDEGAPAHLRRIQKSLPHGGLHDMPDNTGARLQTRPQRNGPGKDVPRRRVHDDSEPRGAPEHQPEPRLHARGAADERAAASAALRRRGAARLRLRDRKSRRLARGGGIGR